jgi:hypothetical protein
MKKHQKKKKHHSVKGKGVNVRKRKEERRKPSERVRLVKR